MAAPYTDPALGLEKLHLMTERGDLNLLVAAYELGFLSLNREVQFRHLNFLKLSVLWYVDHQNQSVFRVSLTS